MFSIHHSRSSTLGLSPGGDHGVVVLCKTLYSHSASLHQGVYMATGNFNALTALATSGLRVRTWKLNQVYGTTKN